jgi:hypothetical protein
MAPIIAPSRRLDRLRALVAARPGLVDVIGQAMLWDPIEVREFLHDQFDVGPAELAAIEAAVDAALIAASTRRATATATQRSRAARRGRRIG